MILSIKVKKTEGMCEVKTAEVLLELKVDIVFLSEYL